MSGELVKSFKVATTLTSQRIVAVETTAYTVIYPSAATVIPCGITVDDVKSAAQAIPVQMHGVAKLYFNQTVSCGAFVASDTSGRGIAFTPGVTTTSLTLGTGIIGVLVGPSIALTGTVADVWINPQLMR